MIDILKSPDSQLQSAMKDGDFAINYNPEQRLVKERLDRLKRPLINDYRKFTMIYYFAI